jgi:hypothetical protein
MDDKDKGGGGNQFSKYLTIKNYEDFLAQIHMNDEVRNRYWYEMLMWAEHTRHQKNVRLDRHRKKKRAKAAEEEEAAKKAAEAAAEAAKNPVPVLTVANTPRVINLYQGEPKRRGSTLSIPENILMPRTIR